jgi:hypothetical protein
VDAPDRSVGPEANVHPDAFNDPATELTAVVSSDRLSTPTTSVAPAGTDVGTVSVTVVDPVALLTVKFDELAEIAIYITANSIAG